MNTHNMFLWRNEKTRNSLNGYVVTASGVQETELKA